MQTHHALALIPAAVAVLCVVAAVYIVYKERTRSELVSVNFQPQRRQLPYQVVGTTRGSRRPPPKAAPQTAPVQQAQADQSYNTSQPFSLPQAAPPDVQPGVEAQHQAAQTGGEDGKHEDLKTPWQRFAEDDLHGEQLQVPKAQPRVPLNNIPTQVSQIVRLKRLTFQSEERDTQLYPTPSFYRMKMNVPMRNVVSVNMTNAAIPLSEYLVNEYTQWLDVEYLGVLYQVQMPLGDWNTSAGLYASTLQTAMITAGLPATLTVTSNVDTQRLTFATNTGNPWRFLMRSGPNVNQSMWQIIGFPRVDTELAPVLHAPNNLDFQGTYAVEFFIDEISCHLESSDNMVNHVILQKFLAISVTTYKAPPDAGLPRTFFPIARLQYLTFRFLVSYTILEPGSDIPVQKYRPYLCNGRNHTFQLDFGCKEYADMFEQTVELDPQS